MARQINFQQELSEADRHYMAQRPWMAREYEVQTGKSFETPDNGFNDQSEPVNKESAAYVERLETELRQKGAENSALRDQVSSLEGQLNEAVRTIDSIRDAAVKAADEEPSSDEDGEDVPYEQWDYNDLSDEIKERNATYKEEDRKIRPDSRKAEDLVAALEADDNRLQAEEAEESATEE